MGCIQSKSAARPDRTAQKTQVSNGAQRLNPQHNYASKTEDNHTGNKFDLQMRSPRNEATTSGTANGRIGSGSIQFAEDLEPADDLPDTMTICTVNSDHRGLSVSNVNIKQRGSAQSSRIHSSKGQDDLSIEELDTEMDDFSRLRSDSRYIHKPGDRINPATTDILLPRRKQTPFPTDSVPDSHKDNRNVPSVIGETRESSTVTEISSAPASPVTNKGKKGDKRRRKKKKRGINNKKKEMGSSNESISGGTITIDNLDTVKTMLAEEPDSVQKDDEKDTTDNLPGSLGQGSYKQINDKVEDVTDINTDTTKHKTSDSFTKFRTENSVTEVTRAIVSDYLKETDVSKVEVNSVFQDNFDREKARMARKRKRSQENKYTNKENQERSLKPSDQEIEHFFRDKGASELSGLRYRTVSKTSIVSIASMDPVDSERIFDQSAADTSALMSENTMDEFDGRTELVDIEDEFGGDISEGMDNKSLHSTTSVKSVFGIKPYKSTPQSVNQDNCSLRDIGFDVQSGSSVSNVKTKQKLIYSRHARRPMSETVLRLAGKPPIPPSQGKLVRPHSDTLPRGMQSYSRYMTSDTDLF